MPDVASLAILFILLAAALAALRERRHRRVRVMRILHAETLGLAREAAELAEGICRRQKEGVFIDQPFLDRHVLGEPRTYPGLASSLWRLPSDFPWRAVEFHGHLARARARLPGWRDGARDKVSTYLLVSALSRAANAGHGLVHDMEQHMGWRHPWRPDMPSVTPLMDDMEHDDQELMDHGYWSDPT